MGSPTVKSAIHHLGSVLEDDGCGWGEHLCVSDPLTPPPPPRASINCPSFLV